MERARYPSYPPFHPSIRYPEYPFTDIASEVNEVYDGTRQLLVLSRLDHEHYGTPEWNPLSVFIKPGMTVLLKPNLVFQGPANNKILVQTLVTHGSVVRAMADYCILALKGRGHIILGDAPLQSGVFEEIVRMSGINSTMDFYKSSGGSRATKGITLEMNDFRTEAMRFQRSRSGVVTSKEIYKLPGDPNGYRVVNLGSRSCLHPIRDDFRRFRVTDYNPHLMKYAHNLADNKYLIANSVLQADVVIELPKIKTHRKAGITGCLKNNIGINGHKDWLPHHRTGSKAEGGDEYLHKNAIKKIITMINDFEDVFLQGNKARHINVFTSIAQLLLLRVQGYLQKDPYSEGSWYGNDTLWRTILDLNKILLYADKSGRVRDVPQRRRLYLCDAIFAGEGEGPLEPSPRREGLMLFGQDPVMVDLAVAEIMGFDYRKIPSIRRAFKQDDLPITNYQPSNMQVVSNAGEWNDKGIKGLPGRRCFTPTRSWQNHIEKHPPYPAL